jgi:hypothetical protein
MSPDRPPRSEFPLYTRCQDNSKSKSHGIEVRKDSNGSTKFRRSDD